ncbi:BolA family protein [Kozakia baliensis]|nr:BolA family protein [Kozakia baliensis]
MSELRERAVRMAGVLEKALEPQNLQIQDDSAKHAGHAAKKGLDGGETHFTISVVSPRFSGLNRVARHRLVNELLAPEFETGLHALSLVLLTPEEQ